MSSVQDEADKGHAELTEDEENEEEEIKNVEKDNDEIASFGELQEPGERKDEEESLTRNGATLHSSGSQILATRKEDSENSDLPSHRALGRPSSADGSLSIPDDTPSLQVYTQQDTLDVTLLTSPGLFSIFSSQKYPRIELWSKPHTVVAPIR